MAAVTSSRCFAPFCSLQARTRSPCHPPSGRLLPRGSVARVCHTRKDLSHISRYTCRAEGPDSPGSTSQQQEKEEEELPPWARREQERKLAEQEGSDLPFGVYLLASAVVAIAAVGSIFEFANHRAVFGVVQPDSFLYTPILGLFAITGLPTSGYLFYKAVSSANAESDRMDKVDGL